MKKRERLGEIDLVRGMAILGVLLVHASAWATVDMKDSGLYGIYNFINIFSKFGTTTFIFLSSFVLFYQYYPQKLTLQRVKKFYRNRLLYILVPYVFFSVLYYGWTWYLQGGNLNVPAMAAEFGKKLLMGTAFYHLYFVFVSVQFYLLFPLLLLLFQRYKKLSAYAFLIGVVLQWLFFIWNQQELHVPNRGNWALSYFSHFFLGAWLGMRFDRLKPGLSAAPAAAHPGRLAGRGALWMLWLASGFLHAWLWYQSRKFGAAYSPVLFDAVWNVYTLLTALVFMRAAFLLNRSRAAPVTASLRILGILSFGIYLLHPLILSIYERFPVATGVSWHHHLWYAGGFLLILLGTSAVVAVVCRLSPRAWIAFGGIPAQLQAYGSARGGTRSSSASSAG